MKAVLQDLAQKHLGVSYSQLSASQGLPLERMQVVLVDWKARAKKAFKERALELHPDRTGGDAEKADLFAALVQTMEEIDKIEIVQYHPAPMRQTIVVTSWSSPTSFTSSSAGGGWVSSIRFNW